MYKKYQSEEDKFFIKSIKIIFFFIMLLALTVSIATGWGEIKNLKTEEIWNYGVCPTCNEKYKLLKVKNDKFYYQCPKCKTEVIRYKEIIKREYGCYSRNLCNCNNEE